MQLHVRRSAHKKTRSRPGRPRAGEELVCGWEEEKNDVWRGREPAARRQEVWRGRATHRDGKFCQSRIARLLLGSAGGRAGVVRKVVVRVTRKPEGSLSRARQWSRLLRYTWVRHALPAGSPRRMTRWIRHDLSSLHKTSSKQLAKATVGGPQRRRGSLPGQGRRSKPAANVALGRIEA